MADSAVKEDQFVHVKKFLKLVNFTTKLDSHLKESLDNMVSNQAILQNLIEKQWHMKGSVKPLMNYAEISKQLMLDPELWITQEELDEKSSEILKEYKNERDKFKRLSVEAEEISAVFDEAEATSLQEQAIQFKLKEIQGKRKKLEAYKKTFSACPEEFKKLCGTSDRAEEMIREKRREVEEQKKAIALLESTVAETELHILKNPEMALLSDAEKFASESIAADVREQLQCRMQLTSKLLNL